MSIFEHRKLFRVGFLGGTVIKNPSANAMWVQCLGWEDLLEKEMATYSSILAWEIPWSHLGYSSWGHKESDMTE